MVRVQEHTTVRELTHFVGSKHTPGTSGSYGDVYDPNTGEVQARVPLASRAETEATIADATLAQRDWRDWDPQRRARVLLRFLPLVNKERDSLARLLSSEHGKTIPDSLGDIQRGLEVVEFAAGIPHLLKGEFTDNAGTGIGVHSLRAPFGVVAGITPFNFPAMIPLWKAAPALACGNAFILKPSERDPSDPDAAALTTRTVRDGDHWVLTGVKQFISGAGVSQLYVVMARTGGDGPDGVSAFVVDKDDPGLSFGANERKMGWNAQPTRQVVLDTVRLPADRLLGPEGHGFRIAMNGLNGGRLGIAACSLGGARSALDRSLAHLADREAFGRRLLDAQALRFRLADMATELAAARALVQQAARALDTGDPQAPYLCAMAKRFATDTGYAVADRALQLHGGYGYLSEYGIEKIVRDLRVHQILEGTNEIMRVIVARGLTEALG
ncbi:aldehyde dehydrogenase family protein [Streptomyces avermitilis]|uniref:aldehyde dehydrogenase family protein n=1 Tax=Streptomyces avermitilis TaxID=33903 RepID=UPI0033C53F53